MTVSGFTIYDTWIEPAFDACFECPFPDCDEGRQTTLQCPRRAAVYADERDTGDIPAGYITTMEAASVMNVAPTTIKWRCRTGHIPGAMKVNDRWYIPVAATHQ